jgi:arylsulfatase A-like enzyme
MSTLAVTSSAQATQPDAARASDTFPAARATPGGILLASAWFGLVIGFVDLVLFVIRKNWVEHDFYRVGNDFPWVIPAVVTAVSLIPGVLLALGAWLFRLRIASGIVTGLVAFVPFLDLVASLPRIDIYAHLLLSAGLSAQTARLAGRRSEAFFRWMRRTTPVLGGLLVAIAAGTLGGRAWGERRALANLPPPPSASAQNVLLIVWDTVRAQNLSLYGYHRPTTPNLAELARRGVRFARAYATAPWTLPSHASLFTGHWPHEQSGDWSTALDDAHTTLAEYLRAQGYDTAGFAANIEYCTHETGLNRGFTHYEDYPLDRWDTLARYPALGHRLDFAIDRLTCTLDDWWTRYFGRPSRIDPRSKIHAKRGVEVERAFQNWLNWQQTRGRPFFAFLNFIDAHVPFEVPDPTAPGFGMLPQTCRDREIMTYWNMMDKTSFPQHFLSMAQDTYDTSIAYLDQRLASLLRDLGRRGALENTIVIVTSDHGEHFGEHRLFSHGCSLYRELVEVPLVIVDPRHVPGGPVVKEPASLRDIPATVVDLLGLDRDAPFPGQSLSRFWDRDEASEAGPILMEASKPLFMANQGREPVAKGPMKALISSGMHYIRTADGNEELYSLETDPREEINLAGRFSSLAIINEFRVTMQTLLQRH